MSKMDDMRKVYDEQTPAVPATSAMLFSEDEINNTIAGEVSRVRSQKVGMDQNRTLALRILDLNPDLPTAYRAKFEVMTVNSHFAKNVHVVINDCYKHGIELKLTEPVNGKLVERV